MAKDDGYLLADEALQLSASEGPMRIEGAWCVRVRVQDERVGRSQMINRKERVERNGAGAFLVSIDRRCLKQLVRQASSQGMGILWCWWLRDLGWRGMEEGEALWSLAEPLNFEIARHMLGEPRLKKYVTS